MSATLWQAEEGSKQLATALQHAQEEKQQHATTLQAVKQEVDRKVEAVTTAQAASKKVATPSALPVASG